MEDFSFARFSFTICGETSLSLPAYKGSTLRGGFGHAFRRVVCVFKDRDCADCLLKEKCVYSWTFETPIPENAEILRKYTAAPHPFILEPPEDTRTSYEPGETLSFGLILIGRAIDYLAYFIYTFEELGRIGIGKNRGKYKVVTVTKPHNVAQPPSAVGILNQEPETGDQEPIRNSSPEPRTRSSELMFQSGTQELRQVQIRNPESEIRNGNDPEPETRSQKRVVYDGITKQLAAGNGVLRWPDIIQEPPPSQIRISFLTPTRLKYEGGFVSEDLEFHILFRNLLRRISLLSYFHCGHRLDDTGFKDLIEPRTSKP